MLSLFTRHLAPATRRVTHSRHRVLALEGLERRELLATFTVVSTLDAGPGSLRQAILDANASQDGGTIQFNIPQSDPNYVDVDAALPSGDPQPDVWRIQPLTELPEINHPTAGILIDARTQTAIASNPNPFGPEIVLDGNGVFARGLVISTSNHTVAGLNIQRFGRNGIYVAGGDRNVILGNYIGVDATGTVAAGNERNGIGLDLGASANRIGTDGDGVNDGLERNVIGANGLSGVLITGLGSDDNVVAGNLIGSNAAGTEVLGNLNRGVDIEGGAKRNRIGTNGDNQQDAAEGNLISGNAWEGVNIGGQGTSLNVVAGNRIGTDMSGVKDLGNLLRGVNVGAGASGNQIGGASGFSRNLISGNDTGGINVSGGATQTLIVNNYIGTDANGGFAIPNTGSGVRLGGGATNNVVGTNSDGVNDSQERNLISGNSLHGVLLTEANTTQNVVAGNFIGTDFSGNLDLGNAQRGVAVDGGAAGNLIGGSSFEASNVISGNDTGGIRITPPSGGGATNILVKGNYIGVNVDGVTAVPNNGFGIVIDPGASGNTIGVDGDGVGDLFEHNVISGNNNSGVRIFGAGTTNNVVAGNLIGTSSSSMFAIPNDGHGISIGQGASGNRIGTNGDGLSDDSEKNIISGNAQRGVLISDENTNSNIVAGNYIGINALGIGAVGNAQDGVLVQLGAKFNRIGTDGDGTADEAERNTISGNLGAGINIASPGTDQNVVTGNFIGTAFTGNGNLGNATEGIRIQNGAKDNRIGGSASVGNRIAFNGRSGVALFANASTGNSILGNQIFSNTLLGIDLGNDGVTPNDAGDADAGPNNTQNAPSIDLSVLIGQTVTLDLSIDAAAYPIAIEIFKADSAGQEGESLVAFALIEASDPPTRRLALLRPSILNAGDNLVATATDAAGNTSEFSQPLTLSQLANPWHNASRPLDVTGDDNVVPADVLVVISYLNAFGSRPIAPEAPPQAPFYDTNNDGQISPADSLNIINAINAGLANAEGEAAQADEVFTSLGTTPDHFDWLLATDWLSKPRKSR